MTEQEIIEGNKLIMEFEGKRTINSEEWINSNKILVGEPKYHSSWDWLMPAYQEFYQGVYLDEWWADNYDDYACKEMKLLELSLIGATLPAAFLHFTILLTWYNKTNDL